MTVREIQSRCLELASVHSERKPKKVRNENFTLGIHNKRVTRNIIKVKVNIKREKMHS